MAIKRLLILLLVASLSLFGVGAYDADNDGMANFEEWRVGTDALAADTDADGLADGAELNRYFTDPTNPDTDGDGLNDSAEVEVYGSDPTQVDTDSDCLNDSVEVRGETEVAVSDTDGDGLPDGAERKATDALPSADPTHKDVYVELDYMRDYRLSEESLERVRRAFASAPVSNPDDERGIDLHVIRDERVQYTAVVDDARYDRLIENRFDRRGFGYHHAVLIDRTSVPEPVASGDTRTTFPGTGSAGRFLVSGTTGTSTYRGRIFMHELGQSLGLTSIVFEGIDRRTVPFEDYPSVMNYNAFEPSTSDYFDYSNGTNSPRDHDDWEYVEQNMYQPDTSNIEAALGCSSH